MHLLHTGMESSTEQTLCFVTWNICGIKNISPHIDVLSKKIGAEIFFLQETHIGPNDKTLENLDSWQSYFTVYDSRSKGVAILIKDGVSFQYICHDEDYTGGYLVLFCRLNGELFTLVNVYQHEDDKDILNSLRDYLRETAEGVLVVGGDFNTVLDLCFDRKSIAEKLLHRPSWEMFKKFTASLNLIDTWAYFHPTVKKFTYSQNESSSRLDMFLFCEEDLEQINECDIYEFESSVDTSSTSKKAVPSDHLPFWIRLKIKEQSSNEVPNVASWLEDRFKEEPDRREGKINGAEILSVIKSLTDSGHQRPDGIYIQTYKNCSCQLTEILKISFNICMKCQQLPEDFNSCISASDCRKHFNVYHLIFTMILAKRLNVLLNTSSEKKSQVNKSDYCFVTFAVKPCAIKWSFLAYSLSYLLEHFPKKKRKEKLPPEIVIPLKGLVDRDAESTKKNSILKIILPEGSNLPDDFRKLQDGCPLTRSILSLVLKYLEIRINRKGYTTHVCPSRQAVVIHEDYQKSLHDLKSLFKRFKKKSGIELNIVKMNIQPILFGIPTS